LDYENDVRKALKRRAVKGRLFVTTASNLNYRFVHDRIHKDAFSKELIHVRLGVIIWNMTANAERKEWEVFLAADQLNQGVTHIGSSITFKTLIFKVITFLTAIFISPR
jgi:hypothetical protein